MFFFFSNFCQNCPEFTRSESDDDKDEHGAIDTPGIIANQNANNLEYKEVEKKEL